MAGTRWYLVSLKHIIDLGLQRQFSGSTDEVSFGSVTIGCNPQAFQDDIVTRQRDGQHQSRQREALPDARAQGLGLPPNKEDLYYNRYKEISS